MLWWSLEEARLRNLSRSIDEAGVNCQTGDVSVFVTPFEPPLITVLPQMRPR
jgi:hypothetical protein